MALDTLADAVINGWGNDSTMTDGLGWFAPAITRHELADLAKSLADDIRTTDSKDIDASILSLVCDIPRRLQVVQANTVPQFYSGNGGQAIPAYISTLTFFRTVILPPLGWQIIPDQKSLPSSLVRRAKSAQLELDQLTPNTEKLRKQIEEIRSAHAVADALPTDLQSLSEGKELLNKVLAEITESSYKIKEFREDSLTELSSIKEANTAAVKLVEQCEEAYHITTTKGLAGAFDQRAVGLSRSMWVWVAGLTTALGIGSWIGASRLQALSAALSAPNPNLGSLSIQVILSLLSVGAPLWFAWLATKQIGQRFRLAEDYAFKASVAKAYEGYRKEAARIDPEFESRLFSSALDRLDEAPLRLVEAHNHGSPWHELANSDAVQRAFRVAPELQSQATSLLSEGVRSASQVINPTPKATKIDDPTS